MGNRFSGRAVESATTAAPAADDSCELEREEEAVLELDRSRKCLVECLVRTAGASSRVLVHGRWGIGKSTLLMEAARSARSAGLRVGYVRRTERLEDVVAALERAYGQADAELPARRRRSSLRRASELHAGVILLDGFRARGTTLVGFLRSLRGKRLAVIAAADVEHPRDLAAVRAVDLAYREVAVAPLTTATIARHLDRLTERAPSPFQLSEQNRRDLLRLAAGCPGVLQLAWARLLDARYWRAGRPLIEAIHADVRVQWLAASRPMPVAEREMP
jgi:hypothetical protein